eukprot:6457646-Amphidinium_carterae.1
MSHECGCCKWMRGTHKLYHFGKLRVKLSTQLSVTAIGRRVQLPRPTGDEKTAVLDTEDNVINTGVRKQEARYQGEQSKSMQ